MDVEEYTFSSLQGDQPLTADVYYSSSPKSTPETTRPILIWFYGGGFVAGAKEAVSKDEIEALVLEFGFVVVVPNYRHCPTVSVYNGPIRDGKDCYNWVQKELPKLLSGKAGVTVNGNKIAVVGSSAGGTIALQLAAELKPPKAILALYAVMYLQDPFWHTPMAALSKIPSFPQEFLDQVLQEGTVTSTPSSFKTTPSNPTPVPDFSRSRVAWLLTNLKEGTWLRNVVQDEQYNRVDPSMLFSANFPPTCFVHGTEDKMCEPRFSGQAYQELQRHNVESKLLLAEGKGHDFDGKISKDNPDFSLLREAFNFLAQQVGV